MAKQKPCQKQGRNKRSDAAKAATAARKLQNAKAAYAAKLNSQAFQKAVNEFNWVAPIEHPVTIQEVIQCQKALDNFLALAKNTISEKQLDAAQKWVVGIEAKNFNAKKQQEILTLANTNVEEARVAAHKLFVEFKAAQKAAPKPNFVGKITYGVPNSVKWAQEYKALRAKKQGKQKPVLKSSSSKKGSGFAPKQFALPTPVILEVDEPSVQVVFKVTYASEYEAYKKAYFAGVEEERQRKAQEAADAAAEQKRREKERQRLAALRAKRLAEAKAKARKEAALKAREDFRKFVALHEAAMQLIEEAQRFNNKELAKRVRALEANLTSDFFTLKKKFDFASSALFATQKVAA